MAPRPWKPGAWAITLLAIRFSVAGLAPSIRDFDGTGTPPAHLSGTGLYRSMDQASRTLGDGITPYEVNSPLWTDGAAKQRFISPPPGTTVVPTDTDGYEYPEGTVFIKNFQVDTVYGDSSSRILVETRFLVRHAGADPTENPWHGITYQWARDQTDAELVSQEMGRNTLVNVRVGGILRGKRWTFPSRYQCNTCHFNRGVLGFITPQLNRPSAADASVNQLEALRDAGVLSFDPLAGKAASFRWAGLGETDAPLETRARSYFASNCSHCHGNGPPGTSPGDHVFDFFHPETSIEQGPQGLNGAYVGKLTHQGGDPFPQFIYKGYPESSYVLKRMLVRQDFDFVPTEQMPTLGTFQPDSAALNLLREWICSLGDRPDPACRLPRVQADPTYWDRPAPLRPGAPETPEGRAGRPSLAGGMLRMAPGKSGTGPELFDMRGRPWNLVPVGPGAFRAEPDLRPGIYLIRSDGRTTVAEYLP